MTNEIKNIFVKYFNYFWRYLTATSIRKFFLGTLTLLIFLVSIKYIFLNPKEAGAAWYNDSWGYRIKLTIDNTKVDADLTDFPVYVDLSLLPSSFHSHVNQTDAKDIRVTTGDGSTELPREVVFYTAASDKGELHFKYTGTLSSTVDTDVYIYFGNAGASDYAATDTYGKNNVWDTNYEGVWHLTETTGAHADSTTNANNSISPVVVTTQGTANSKLGGADDFDGVDDVIDIESPASLDNLGPFTYSAWVYPESGGEVYGRIFDKAGAMRIYFNDIDVSNTLELKVDFSTTDLTVISGAETITWNTWQLVTVTWDGSTTATNVHLYINGSETTYYSQTNAVGTQVDDNAGNFYIANTAATDRTFDGQIDDATVSSSVRSSTWISTQYNNQNSPSTFFTTNGVEEQKGRAILNFAFDEGYGTTAHDSSPNGYVGTLSGATTPSWQTEDMCISGKCLYYQGSTAYTSVTTPVSNTQSISFWVRPKTNSETLMDFDGGTHYITTSSGTITASGFSSPTIYVNGISGGLLVANTWQHIEVTTATGFSASAITIGKYSTTYLNGFIDEFKVYDYVRSSAQVKLDYNSRNSQSGAAVRFGPDTSWISSGLVGYWKMDEASGNATDTSGNGLTLTNNGTTAYVGGKYANGSEYVPASSQYFSTATTITGVKTISFWTNPDSTTNYLAGMTTGAYITASAGVITATGFTNPTIYVNGVASTTLTQDVWQLVTITTTTGIDANQFYIGRQGSNYYDGTIDDVRVYNRAFSPSEVQSLYNFAPGPVGWWKLDENTGSSFFDSSTNNNIATVTNINSTIAAEQTVIGSVGDGGGSTVTLSSWTPGANELILVSVAMRDQTITPTVSGNGITFTQIVDVNNTQSQGGITLFRGMSASPTTGSITVTVTGNAWPVMAVATRFSGTDISGTNGSGAIEAQATDPGPAVDNDDVKINITTLSDNAWAYAAAWHRNYNLTNPTGSGDITISLNNRAGTNGDDTTDSTWYESAATPSTVTLGSDNNMSTVHDWAIIAVSIKPYILNSTPSIVSGKYGSAVSFSGNNQYIFRADDPDFDFADDADITLETWFKHRTASTQEILISKFNEAGYKIIMESDGDITCGLDYDSTWTPTDSATSTAGTYDDNNWHHIACVKTGATSLSLYIDGVLIATDSSLTATNTLTNSDPIYFGIDADGTSNDFSGILDDIKIYNYARTSSQVVEDMNSGHPASKSPVVNYKFDEGYGTTTNNSGNAGSDKNGTITSGTWTNSGKFNQALTFTASTSVTTTITDPTYNNTISLWVYPTTSAASKTLVTATKLITDSSSRPTYGSCVGTALALSTWTHIVAVSNGSGSCTIYQNGVQTATGTTGVTFGTSINLGGTSYIGSIDEFKFYNFPFTPDQIKVLYNQNSGVSFGSLSTDSSGNASNSLTDSYCPPGQGTTCVGPVAHWKMDENTGSSTLYDTSGNGYNLTINNYYSGFWQAGKMGGAMRTNNADGVVTNGSITDDSSAGLDFSDSQDFTISMWTKHISKENTHYILFYNGADSDSSAGYNMAVNSSNQFECNYADTDVGPMDSVSSTTLADGNWHFVSCVMDRNGSEVGTAGWHIFVDGRLEGSDTSFDEGDGSGTVGIKLGESSDTYEYSALIDQVQIFSYARTPAQVAWDYNRGAPIGWWKMDENTGTSANDSMGNSTAGTLTNSPTWTTGKFNQAISFAGSNQHVSIPDDPDFDFSALSSFTIATWFKHNTASATETLISKLEASGTDGGYKLKMESDGDITCETDDDDADTTIDDTITTTLASYDDNNWHHATCVYNTLTTDLLIYIDGVLAATNLTTTTNSLANDDALFIGIESATGTEDWVGQIDDTRIYNYALSAQQIKTVIGGGTVRFGPITGTP